MNTKLSNPELIELYDDFKEFGEDALEGYSMLHIRQLRKHILKQIENYEILQALYIAMNQPKDVEYKIVDSEPDQRALQIVNNMIRKGYKRPEPENTSNEQTTFIAHFKGLEAALYIAFTHPAGYGETQAGKDVKQFDRLTSGKDLYNNVRKIKKENFNHVKNCTTRERPHWIDRLKNIIPHLHTDDQKKTAEEILQHLKKQDENK